MTDPAPQPRRGVDAARPAMLGHPAGADMRDVTKPLRVRPPWRLIVVGLLAGGLLAGVLGLWSAWAVADWWRAAAIRDRAVTGRPLADAEFEEALRLAADATGPFARRLALISAAASSHGDDSRLDRVESVAVGWLDSPDRWVQQQGLRVLIEARRPPGPAARERVTVLAASDDPEVVGLARWVLRTPDAPR